MAKSLKLTLKISGSDALVKNQGYTYNQAGFTYNQAGVMYGGVYNQNEDIVPMLQMAKQIKPHFSEISRITPHLSGIFDIGSSHPTPPSQNSGYLMGILGLTYP